MQNPFQEENPFAEAITSGYTPPDPSLEAVPAVAAEQVSVDVNPFLDPTQGVAMPVDTFAQSKRPDIIPPAPILTQSTPAYGGAYGAAGGGGQSGGTSSSERRGDELAAKEKELAAKERELKEREEALKKQYPGALKNWPSFYPIIYHNISEEIPAETQGMVRNVYYCLIGAWICLGFQAVAVTLSMFVLGTEVLTGWFMAVIYVLTGYPGSLFLWYLRLYRAAKYDRAFSYIMFFFWFTIHIAFCIYACIGLYPGWAFTGINNFGAAFDESSFAGALYVMGFCFWVIESCACLFVLRSVMKTFRGTGKADQLPKSRTDFMVEAAREINT